MHPKPKSALSRNKTKRTNVVKDIEAWALSGTEITKETSRHAGQLTENITEDRLLRGKLIELGKERFKFLAKSAYEKHIFINKQRKRMAVLKRKQTNTTVVKSPTNFSKIDITLDEWSRDNINSPIRASPFLRPKTVQFVPDTFKTSYLTTGPAELLPTRPKTMINIRNSENFNHMRKKISTPIRSPSRNTLKTPLGRFSRPVSVISQTMSNVSSMDTAKTWETAKTWSTRDKCLSTFGQRFPGKTADPRYYKLEAALSPNYPSQTDLDVETIIENVESLHIPSKRHTEPKEKVLEKLRQFMKERGIVFS
ncbi:hypothetical protein ACJMK2_033720 [Sinanodonta woodiana]|uniref:Uncharacterized protein n=1 Tax=Sinanodonta woodiana TaxID=1069815 RepID=A0ABD3WP91_SINWO